MTKVNVDRWRAHVTALRESGLSVTQYAAKHGLSRQTLYAARRQVAAATKALPQRQRSSGQVNQAAPFVAVRVVSSPVALRAGLPNGVTVEFAQLEPESCARLIALLASLPCSN